MSQSVERNREPWPRPSDPAWKWNGHFWDRDHRLLQLHIMIDSKRGLYAASATWVREGFLSMDHLVDDVNQAAREADRMADYLMAFAAEMTTGVVVPRASKTEPSGGESL